MCHSAASTGVPAPAGTRSLGEAGITPKHRDRLWQSAPRGGQGRPRGSPPNPKLTSPPLQLSRPPFQLCPRPAAPLHARPEPVFPGELCEGGESSGLRARGAGVSRDPGGRPQPEAGYKRRGRSRALALDTARPSARPSPPRFRGTRREGTGINTFDFVAKVNGNCHPGATWALRSPGPASPGAGGAGPYP